MEKQPSLLPVYKGPNGANQQATSQPAHHHWPNLERTFWGFYKLIFDIIKFASAVIGALALFLAFFPHGRLLIIMLMRGLKPAGFETFASEVDWKVISQDIDGQRHGREGSGSEDTHLGVLERRGGYEPPEKFDWRKWAVNIPLWISKIKFGG